MKKKITIEDIDIFYEEKGNPDGKPVIILHGWGCSHETVKFIADILSDSYYVYSIDLPGHGLSSEPVTILNTEGFAKVIEEFIKENNISKPSLIGHSFGGRVSIVVSSRNEIDKLVLIDSAGIKPNRSLSYYFKIYSFKSLKFIYKKILGKEKSEELIEKMRKKKGSSDYSNSSPIMRAIMSICVNEDLKKFMPSIKSPTLLIWGENDTATPITDGKIMEKLIPDAGLVKFYGCGHYSFLDNPVGFKSVLKSFFKD